MKTTSKTEFPQQLGWATHRAPWILAVLLAAAFCRGQAPAAAAPAGDDVLLPRSDIPGLGNFAKVSDALWRSQQPTAEGMKAAKQMGVKTVVNLRSMHTDRNELRGLGLQYVHLPSLAWHPEIEDVVQFLKVVSNPKNLPVLVHCQHGADRTGMMVAIYRIYAQGWTVEQALAELPRFGFHEIWRDIPDFLRSINIKDLQRKVAASGPPQIDVVP